MTDLIRTELRTSEVPSCWCTEWGCHWLTGDSLFRRPTSRAVQACGIAMPGEWPRRQEGVRNKNVSTDRSGVQSDASNKWMWMWMIGSRKRRRQQAVFAQLLPVKFLNMWWLQDLFLLLAPNMSRLPVFLLDFAPCSEKHKLYYDGSVSSKWHINEIKT